MVSPHENTAASAALAAMSEPRFLHQTQVRAANGSRIKVPDLPGLPAALQALPDAEIVRSHFHVPLHASELSPGITTTSDESAQAVRQALACGAEHIAVETYTWSILASDEATAIAGTAAELRWLAGVLNLDE